MSIPHRSEGAQPVRGSAAAPSPASGRGMAMIAMTRVAVLYGGISAEREVSLSSGLQVIPALREAGFDVTPIEVGEDIAAVIAALTPRPDAVFNALHGRFGEDGAIQGVLDWLAIPYTHSGVRASALAMDKVAAKAMFAAAGLPIARGRVVPTDELEAADPLPLPYVVKPVSEGSSVGVEIIRHGDNRRAEVARAWRFGNAALVEEYIPGRELTVGVMGDRALAVTEIIADAGVFYDYESKYADGGSRHIIPARVHPDMYDRALDVALARASRARLPRRHALRLPLRRHVGRTGPPRAAGNQHAARPDADLAAAGTGGASRHELLAALRLDGGERDMPRVTRGPRNSVKDRPGRLKLLLRRQKRLLRPAGWIAFAALVVLLGVLAGALGAPGGTLATLRERFGGATAFAGLRVTDVVIEGRANTPEPLLRAALGVSKGDPILGFSVEQARQRIETLSWVEHATVERRLPGTVVVVPAGAPAVRHLAEPGQVRADRSQRPAGRQPERRRIPPAAARRRPRRAGRRRHAARRADRPARSAEARRRRGARRRTALEPAPQQRHRCDAAGRTRGRRRSIG